MPRRRRAEGITLLAREEVPRGIVRVDDDDGARWLGVLAGQRGRYDGFSNLAVTGDLDGDGAIDGDDLEILAGRIGTSPPSS